MKPLSYFRLKWRYGFTLIELLLVIGIIAILASIVIVAINPTKQLGDARDSKRSSDVNTIINAIYQYAIDNNGNFPTGVPAAGTSQHICRGGAEGATCNATVTGSTIYGLTGSYLLDIPSDPQVTTGSGGTYYGIYRTTNGRIRVFSMTPEQEPAIVVER